MYQEIQEKHKERLKKFIVDNDLDYQVVENGISRFHIRSYDGKTLTFYESQGKFILVEYDKDLDDAEKPAFKYHNFPTLSKMMESLSQYDHQLNKVYWQPIMDITLYGIKDVEENWYENIVEGSIYDDQSKTIIYEDRSYSPVLRSPFNTLHEVSPINTMHLEKLNKLYFEIHPISCNEERYLARVLCNNDEKFKEYINFYIWSKKGLKKFVEKLFNDMQQFKDVEKINEVFFKDKGVVKFDRDYYDKLKTEYSETYNEKDLEKVWHLLKKDCHRFLKEIKGSDLLFRGMHNELKNEPVYGLERKKVRKSRAPKDMDIDAHKEFDRQFKEKLGIKLRSEGVFVTKDPKDAKVYSGYDNIRKRRHPYLFFPIGDYQYFYNLDVYDLYWEIRDQDWYLNYLTNDNIELDIEQIEDLVNGYKKGDFKDITYQEITFICDEYYLVDDVFLFKILEKIEKEI